VTPAVELQSLGFRPGPHGNGYRRRGTSFEMSGHWGRLVSTFRKGAQLGDPGLWREQGRRVFELPPWLMGKGPWLVPDIEPEELRLEVLRWAIATADGSRVAGWCPPPIEEVKGWLPAQGLTVQAGALARQGTLIHEPDRLAAVFELAAAAPRLDADRSHWLREVLSDAQSRWRLARVGQTADGAVHAEVDLSGAPHAALEPLFRMALDALRWVVGWLLESVHFLVQGNVTCSALALRPS
jgi:hypothetical protein